MATRKSVRDLSATEKQDLIDGLLAIKHEFAGGDGLSTYDRYVVLHNASMIQRAWVPSDLASTIVDRFRQSLRQTDPQYQFLTQRNAAHRGPAFLPWHREFLRQIEADIQRVLGDSTFGLPYWDWEHDGDLPVADQKNTEVWALLGGDGDSAVGNIVTTPPFGFDVNDPALLNDPTVFADPKSWIIVDDAGRQNGFLRRALGQDTDAAGNALPLPTSVQVSEAVNNIATYDAPDWDERSPGANSFRNVLEGFTGPAGLHNRIHGWVGGSMGPGTSPNDPVFFLHHCNVDRIWSQWEDKNPGWTFEPQANGPKGHNWRDLMFPWNGMKTPISVTVENASRSDDFNYAPAP